ncbi:hypothetical protein GCM10023196_053070 [Actinoallomurus vinaceus]|uniref:Uncharacterized protein n=1 Tax=Actinoallomurus vinaceus TaxID=1080074 RepID=A0ABP8UE18_9ACTN
MDLETLRLAASRRIREKRRRPRRAMAVMTAVVGITVIDRYVVVRGSRASRCRDVTRATR